MTEIEAVWQKNSALFLGPLFVHSFSLDCLWHAYKPTAWQTNSGGGFGDVRYINIKKLDFFENVEKVKKFI